MFILPSPQALSSPDLGWGGEGDPWGPQTALQERRWSEPPWGAACGVQSDSWGLLG